MYASLGFLSVALDDAWNAPHFRPADFCERWMRVRQRTRSDDVLVITRPAARVLDFGSMQET